MHAAIALQHCAMVCVTRASKQGKEASAAPLDNAQLPTFQAEKSLQSLLVINHKRKVLRS